MSYCRWSSDNHDCDLYCYESVSGGFMTHVATSRRIGDTPIPKLDTSSPNDFISSHKEQMRWLETSKLSPIGLPHDGETFADDTREELIERLLRLREIGYRFPDYVIDAIKEEIEE